MFLTRHVPFAIIAFGIASVRADDDDDDEVPLWVNNGGWIILLLATLAMFYGLATVVEEFFVPALNTFCVKYKIPDDVAGATFMAAAASSPEMFAAFISLYFTHSALGVGTILGSELFNHLIISAGSIYYSNGGTIKCDWRLVGREAFFYFLSMLVLLWCLMETSEGSSSCKATLDSAPAESPANDPLYTSKLEGLQDTGCICVHWYHAVALLAVYMLYALVCGYYQQLMALYCASDTAIAAFEEVYKEQFDEDDHLDESRRSSYTVFSEPAENFGEPKATEISNFAYETQGSSSSSSSATTMNPVVDAASKHMENRALSRENVAENDHHHQNNNDLRASLLSASTNRTANTAKTGVSRPSTIGRASTISARLLQTFAPAYIAEGATANLHQVVIEEDSFSCYVWKKSQYYSKIPRHPKAWQLRWCTVDANGFRSARSRGLKEGTKAMDIFNAYAVEVVDEARFLLELKAPRHPTLLQCPSRGILEQLHGHLKKKMEEYQTLPTSTRANLRRMSVKDPFYVSISEAEAAAADAALPGSGGMSGGGDRHESVFQHDEDHEHLLAWPTSSYWVPWHLLVLPIKVLLFLTVADVRKQGDEHKYFQTMLMSVFYLAVFAFVMTSCMDLLGNMVHLDPFLVGIVFAAAGTSFPNVFASMVVARQGLGNAAISNALGGNVFNICIGLGLPWICYIFSSGSEYVDYDNYVFYGLAKGGILFPLLLLAILLVAFILLLVVTNWRLYMSHAHLALVLYAGFLVWVFLTKMQYPDLG